MRSDLLDLLVLVAHPDSKVTAEAPRQNRCVHGTDLAAAPGQG